MKSGYLGVFITVLITSLAAATPASAQYQPVSPAFTQQDMPQSGQKVSTSNIKPITFGKDPGAGFEAMMDNAMGQLMVNWPQDSIGFNQVQSILEQYPAAKNLQVVFPNQQQFNVTPAALASFHDQYLQKATGLGLGGGSLPELAFSSLANAAASGQLGTVPITAIQNGASAALEPMMQEMRYKQMELWSWVPNWMKDLFIASYDFVLSCYSWAVDWIGSFF